MKKKETSVRQHVLTGLKGIAMGAADVVPGVSGGTIAFITGIYDELLESINHLNFKALGVLKNEGLKKFWEYINGTFLTVLMLGIGTSIVSLAKLIDYLMAQHTIGLWSFFFGLVGASIIYVGKQVEQWNVKTIVALIVGTIAAYLITVLPPMKEASETWFIFISGLIAICAMILPGISGSFILLILGAYPTIIEAISSRNLPVMAVFALGCIIGLLSFSRILKYLLDNFRGVTIAVLTGFLLGSLNKLWPWKTTLEFYIKHAGTPKEKMVPLVQENVLPQHFDTPPQLFLAIAMMLIGFGLIFGLEFVAVKLQKKN
jgi:putative membrane protein